MAKKKSAEAAVAAGLPASTPGIAIDIGISSKDREKIAKGLSHLLADTYTLYLQTHNFHWNVEGPMFNTLHLMFMTQYTELWNALDLVAERVRALGYPAPATNTIVLGYEIDALWPSSRLIVELDSWKYHAHRAAFERDRARDPTLLLAGYRTIRVTDRRLRTEPDRLEHEIRTLLRRS